jgi:hypothetical protein
MSDPQPGNISGPAGPSVVSRVSGHVKRYSSWYIGALAAVVVILIIVIIVMVVMKEDMTSTVVSSIGSSKLSNTATSSRNSDTVKTGGGHNAGSSLNIGGADGKYWQSGKVDLAALSCSGSRSAYSGVAASEAVDLDALQANSSAGYPSNDAPYGQYVYSSGHYDSTTKKRVGDDRSEYEALRATALSSGTKSMKDSGSSTGIW